MFQKGFRDKLKKKNRYASYVPRLGCKSEMFEGEFRTAALRSVTLWESRLLALPVNAGYDRFHLHVYANDER